MASISRLAAPLLLSLAFASQAQEGFPLDGTWRGQVGERTIVLVMQWDGNAISGMINPGPNSIAFDSAELIPQNWGVRIEAHSATGAEIALRGTLTDIGSYNRRIEGTWTEAGITSEVVISRE